MTAARLFTDDFMDYASEVTDCPESLIFWSGILAISSIIGRKVFMRFGDGELVPNIWMILLGPSSAHKSTALKLARNILRIASQGLFEKEACEFYAQEWTREKLLQMIERRPHGLMLYDEVRIFFDLCERDYNAGAMAALTTLFEEPEYKRETLGATTNIENAYICFGGASTPEWLTQGIRDKKSAILSGFLPRFLLINSPKKQEKVMAWYKPVDQEKKAYLVNSLQRIGQFRGEAKYTPEAALMYETWFEKFHRRMERSDSIMMPFLNKLKSLYAHRIAIIAAADMGTLPDITPESFRQAERMLNSLEASVHALVGGLIETPWDKERNKIIDYIMTNLTCDREVLADTVHIHGKRLTSHLTGLSEDGKVKIIQKSTGGRPKTIIEWIGNGND